MSELQRQLEGVTADPPAAIPNEPEPLDDSLEREVMEPSEEPSAGEPKPERPIENVKAEFDRKFRNLEARILDKLDQLKPQPSVVVPEQSGGPTNELDRMSVAQLQQLRTTLQPDQQRQLDDYLMPRIIRETVRSEVATANRSQAVDQARRQAGTQAATRYPDLMDPTSDFHQRVNARLMQLGRGYIDQNPRAVLDVANEVAIETGYAGRISRAQPTVANRSNQGPVPQQGPPAINERIANRLADAMPGRKFDPKRVAEGIKFYQQNQDAIVRGNNRG